MLKNIGELTANSLLANSIVKSINRYLKDSYDFKIEDEIFQTIKIQLMALGLIEVQPLTTTAQTVVLFWILTDFGKQQMLQNMSLKSKTNLT